MPSPRFPQRFPLLILSAALATARAGSANASPDPVPALALDRIVPGWTNYSTAFNATHDTGNLGDHATVAAAWSPDTAATLAEFSIVVIGSETRPPDFTRFQFRVMAWSGRDAFITNPREGDLATWNFAAPTGGSTTAPDAWTRAGRPAYVLRFALTNQPVRLDAGREHLVGFAALGDIRSAGELFVPTSSHPGPSDLQAGDLVVGGWRNIADAGGSTIYSGQLALRLTATEEPPPRPRLAIARDGRWIRLSWTAEAQAQGFVPESAFDPAPNAEWSPIDAEPFEENGAWHALVQPLFGRQWFRLRR